MVSQTEVVDGLYVARRDGSQPSGLGQVQFGLDEALDVQLAVLRRFQAAGDTLGGWKVGLTSGKGRDLMGKDFRPFGYVLKRRILQSGAAVAVANIMDCQLEPEICLIVGSPLRGDDVDVARAKAAVRAVAPAFEINEIRLSTGRNLPLTLADGLAQWGVVVGPEGPVRDGLIDTTVEFYCDGKLIESKTPGTTMDDPYLSLSHLCKLLHKHGLGLEPGQPVITGSFCHHAVRGPGTYRALFSGVGEVALKFI